MHVITKETCAHHVILRVSTLTHGQLHVAIILAHVAIKLLFWHLTVWRHGSKGKAHAAHAPAGPGGPGGVKQNKKCNYI